jgi:hypothetical protein
MQVSQLIEGQPIIKAKILDPYVVLLRIDGSIEVYKLDKRMELADEDCNGIKVRYSARDLKVLLIDEIGSQIQISLFIQGPAR